LPERLRVDCPLHTPGKQRLDLRGEPEPIALVHVEQGLDPQPVSGQEERLSVSVPEREREYSAQVLDTRLAVILIQMYQDFGVAFGLKPMPLCYERVAQLPKIVDLSVHHYAHRSALVPDRLASARHVNNAQPPHGQAHFIFHIPPLIIRPTMDEASDHSGQ